MGRPSADGGFSGKFLLRIPPVLHQALAEQAGLAGRSLNALVTELLGNAHRTYVPDALSSGASVAAPVTLEHIRAVVGCSKATVSRALAGDSRIGVATRQKVHAAARELGYKPDPALAALADHRWKGRRPGGLTMGLVTADGSTHQSLVDGVRMSAEKMGYRVDVLELRKLGGPEPLIRIAQWRGIQGLVFLPVPDETRFSRSAYDLRGFSAVCVMRTAQTPPVHGTTVDMFASTLGAVLAAVERGYRRIAPVIHSSPQFVDPGARVSVTDENVRAGEAIHFSILAEQHLRRRAALAVLREELKGRAEILPAYEGPMGSAGRSAMVDWVRQHAPDCVVGLNDSVFWGLWDADFRAPRDVGYCSIMTQQYPPGVGVQPSGFLPHFHEITALAVGWLSQLMRQHESGYPDRPQTLRVKPGWCEGHTLPPAGRKDGLRVTARRRHSAGRQGGADGGHSGSGRRPDPHLKTTPPADGTPCRMTCRQNIEMP